MDNVSVDSKYLNLVSKPIVSWLLCSHVVNDYLRLAIKSCLDQSFQDFEILVVANGNHVSEIEAAVTDWFGCDPRLRILTTEIRHLIFSLNLGLHNARGEFIARMDGDDISKPDRLEKQVRYMLDHPDVDVLGTAFEVIDDSGLGNGIISNPIENDLIRKSLFFRNPICHPSVIFRKRVILDAGGYFGGLHAEDYELWSRLALIPSIRFHNLSDVCLGYRIFGVGESRRSRFAYSTVGASQMRNFIFGFDFRWLVSCFCTIFKAIFKSNPVK